LNAEARAVAQLITPATVKASLPWEARLTDFFRPQEEFSIEWTSPEDKGVSMLWGLYDFENGEHQSFIVRGKPGFCAAVIAELSSKGKILDKRPRAFMAFWTRVLAQ
jgi:hypothetical protein